MIQVQGVVAGAAERVPVMSFTYRIKGAAGLMSCLVCSGVAAMRPMQMLCAGTLASDMLLNGHACLTVSSDQ
jgi:hypothetical protein